MRDQLLEIRRKQILKNLEEWAQKEGILQPGEQLVFSLHIKKVSTVTEDLGLNSSVLDLKIKEFFTPQQMKERGCPKPLATRIAHQVCNSMAYGSTVRELLRCFPNPESLKDMRNIGDTSIRYLIPIMEDLWPLAR